MVANGARIESVSAGSPADDVGFYSGCCILSVDEQPIRDILDWRWLTAGFDITVKYRDMDGDVGEVSLVREHGEDWGIHFDGAIFSEIKLCRNTCIFCFMRQLPAESRPSLSLRDDDFRLSFLQGTFITMTNISAEDESRIIEQHISPLRVSLHAVSPGVRSNLIGSHAAHGLAVCERLLAAGIQMHMQIVLVPGINDGDELRKTLAWAYSRQNIKDIGIVPLGFTKHQSIFTKSFTDLNSARNVISSVQPFQLRAHQEKGTPWVFLADEFYRSAFPSTLLEQIPSANHYGEYDLFEDGIGIIRSTIEEWREAADTISKLAQLLEEKHSRIYYIVGYAQREFLIPLVAQGPLQNLFIPLPIRNDYFGGNVDVTGLLCGCDIVNALKSCQSEYTKTDLVVLPDIIFNTDGITLDDMTLEDIRSGTGIEVEVVSCSPAVYLEQLAVRIKSA